MNGSKKRILLIGAGDYAYTAHWPAIRENAELVGIVDLESRKEKLPKDWANYPFIGIPDNCNGRKSDGNTNTSQLAISLLEDALKHQQIDAVIVSTYGAHSEYVEWALNRGCHVLVDKPLTILPGMVKDSTIAKNLICEFKKLTQLADRNKLLFMLATQRRYNPLYEEIALEMKRAINASDPSTNYVRSVQAFTSDGYFLPFEDYTFGDLGGKIKNTGYHVIDIVTWLLRQVTDGITDAVIQVSPLCIDHLARLAEKQIPDEQISKLSPSELYASIQITFRKAIGEKKEKVSYCVFQFHAQHENFAVNRTKTDFPHVGDRNAKTQYARQNRTKEEELRIALGPFFRVYFRRVARVLDSPGVEPGKEKHAYLEFSRSYPGVEGNDVFEKKPFPYKDLDSKPAEEFLSALGNPHPNCVKVRSLVKDHAAAVSLFSGIYEGIANARNGDFQPVFIPLEDKWSPMYGTVPAPTSSKAR